MPAKPARAHRRAATRTQAASRAPQARARRAPPLGGLAPRACRVLEQRQLDLLGLGAGRGRRLPRVRRSTSAGTAGAAGDGARRRPAAACSAASPTSRRSRCVAAGGVLVLRAGAARRAPAAHRRALPALGAHARARRRARSASAAAPRARGHWDAAVARAARRRARRGALLGRLDARRRRRRAHPRGLPVPRRACCWSRGATVAGVVRATGARASSRHDARAAPHRARRSRASAHARDADRAAASPTSEPVVVRATHVEAPVARRRASATRTSFGEEPEEPMAIGRRRSTTRRTVRRARAGGARGARRHRWAVAPTDADLTPQGRYRALGHRRPRLRVEAARRAASSSARRPSQRKPDTAGQEQTATQLVEALGHFGVEAKVVGTVAGPHITRYELRLAPGHRRWPRSRSSRTTSPTRWPRPTSASSRRSPASRRSASRSPTRRRRIVHLGDVFQEPPDGLVAAHGVAGQGRRRQGDRRRPGEDAAPARRRHDRRRQVRLRQRDALLDPAARDARTRCGSCSSTPSRSSSTTTSRSRTC